MKPVNVGGPYDNNNNYYKTLLYGNYRCLNTNICSFYCYFFFIVVNIVVIHGWPDESTLINLFSFLNCHHSRSRGGRFSCTTDFY